MSSSLVRLYFEIFKLLLNFFLNFFTDLTSRHTSILIALISSITTVTSLFVPSLVTLILDAEGTEEEEEGHLDLEDNGLLKAQWNVVFLVTAALHCTGGLVFALTAKAERQKWNGEGGEEEEEDLKQKKEEEVSLA